MNLLYNSSVVYTEIIPSPIGNLHCAASEDDILCIAFFQKDLPSAIHMANGFNPMLIKLRDQLQEYFEGLRQSFDLPVRLYGTEYQLKVWTALKKIPYGQTVSYADVAKQVGSAPIAVGQAVGKNRVNLLIPCHRVIGSNGSLTGYGGGLDRKKYLLKLESGDFYEK